MTITETGNRLLLSLPTHVRQSLLKHVELVHLDQREDIIEANKPIRFIDFPETGVMSVLAVMEDKTLVEVATIGKEGMIGVSVALGVMKISEQVFCQVVGSSLRLQTNTFLNLLEIHPEINNLCRRYSMTLFDQVARNAGCNRTHSIEQRCARWLLMTGDRCGQDQFVLTQEFLAIMLGVSRTGVNSAAGVLAKAGLISYVRGKVSIIDRPNLEKYSCACYGEMNRYFNQTIDQN